MANLGYDRTLIPAGTAVSATGALGTVHNPQNKTTFRGVLVVSAVAGTTPSATVSIQTSSDNGVTDTWRTVASFPAVTAAGTTRQAFTGLDQYIRANVTAFSGSATPSVTLGLSGEVL